MTFQDANSELNSELVEFDFRIFNNNKFSNTKNSLNLAFSKLKLNSYLTYYVRCKQLFPTTKKI